MSSHNECSMAQILSCFSTLSIANVGVESASQLESLRPSHSFRAFSLAVSRSAHWSQTSSSQCGTFTSVLRFTDQSRFAIFGEKKAILLARGRNGRFVTTSRNTPPSTLPCCLVFGSGCDAFHLKPGKLTQPLTMSVKSRAQTRPGHRASSSLRRLA